MRKKKLVSWKELEARGDCRILKMLPQIRMQYAGKTNIRVNPHACMHRSYVDSMGRIPFRPM